MATASELLDLWVDTFNAGKPEAFQAHVVPNGVAEEVGTGRRMNVQEATTNAQAWKGAFPDARGVIENRIAAGNQVVGEIIWRGTNTGSLNGMPPTGKVAEIRAAVVLTEQDGKTVHVCHYLDVAGLLTQLGVMPRPPS